MPVDEGGGEEKKETDEGGEQLCSYTQLALAGGKRM